jgi:iron-sulfur cluster insertion protein
LLRKSKRGFGVVYEEEQAMAKETAAKETAENSGAGVRLSDAAVSRIAVLTAEDTGMMLRVSVAGGGCSGFQYGFTLDDQRNDDDIVFQRDGVALVIDETSLELLTGSEIDFVEDLMGSYFAIKNPQASSTCGCGTSFSL